MEVKRAAVGQTVEEMQDTFRHIPQPNCRTCNWAKLSYVQHISSLEKILKNKANLVTHYDAEACFETWQMQTGAEAEVSPALIRAERSTSALGGVHLTVLHTSCKLK
jgi:hypothetical protein